MGHYAYLYKKLYSNVVDMENICLFVVFEFILFILFIL